MAKAGNPYAANCRKPYVRREVDGGTFLAQACFLPLPGVGAKSRKSTMREPSNGPWLHYRRIGSRTSGDDFLRLNPFV
jgi:hypothetical protein